MLSACTMMTDQSVKFTKHCLVEFREYVHTHEEDDNSMESRTLEALALRPTRNSQGCQYFLNLHTGRVITRFTWTVLLLPNHICKLIRRLVRQFLITLGVLDGLKDEVPDAEPYDDKANEDYVPGEDDNNNGNDDDDDKMRGQ